MRAIQINIVFHIMILLCRDPRGGEDSIQIELRVVQRDQRQSGARFSIPVRDQFIPRPGTSEHLPDQHW